MKKAISVLLAIAMILTVIQAGIFTVSANTSGDYVYTVSVSQATITDYTGSATNLVIPDYLDGYAVVAIGINAFSYCSTLTSVTVPRYVSSIGPQAFSSCPNLTQILVDANNLYFISNGGVLLNYVQTFIYAYPGGKSGAYTVPPTVTLIGASAFEGCANLTGITFNSILNQIGSYAFKKCTSLTTVSIPASVTIISFAFQDCTSLTQINVDPGNTTYKSDNGVLLDYNMQYLLEYPCGKAGGYIIPAGVKYIWSSSFFDCSLMTSISIPSSVIQINNSAFFGCSGLPSVSIPSGVTFIGSLAFSLCYGLSSVVIPSNVATVGARAFGFCSNLNWAFFMGNAPGSFSDDVFTNCAPEFTVYYFSANSGFSSTWYTNNAVAFEPAFSAAPSISTNGSVTVTINYPAIASVREYKIGDGSWTAYTAPIVFTDNGSVWARCSDSTGHNSPEVPFAVTNIDKVAPATPTLSADITQPTDEIVTVSIVYPLDARIMQYTIGHGGTWEDYTEPVQLKENDIVYARCFDAAGNLSETGSIVINYIGYYDYTYTISHSKSVITKYNGSGGDVVIPDTLGTFPVISIDDGAFENCMTLTSVTVPDTVLTISENAFYRCERLHSVNLPDSLRKIYQSAFAGCLALTSITIPPGVNQIADGAFFGCNELLWAYFPGSAPVMGTGVFDACDKDFAVYYLNEKTGFDGIWYGYTTQVFLPSLSAAPTTPTNGNVTVTAGYPAPAAVKEYKIGGGSWLVYTVPVILTSNNTVYVRCTDAIGNTSNELEWTVSNIDRVAPAAPVLSASPDFDTTGYVSVTAVFPADAKVRQYALEAAGGGWVTYTGPIILWAADIVNVRCFDAAGNESANESIKVNNFITIKEGIIEKRGSTAVIDRKANLIYGLATEMTQDDFGHDFIETVGEVRVQYTPDTVTVGTGTRVDVIDGHDEVIASYYIVIFGDINGDGSIDSMDAGTAVDFENYLFTWEPPFNEIMPFAGDINGDGKVDSMDAGIMVDAENYMLTINQVTGLTSP